jgi:hypothetical protein
MTSSSSTRTPSNGNTDKSTRRLFLEAYDSQAQNKVLSFSCKPMSRSDKEKLYERELSLKYHTAFNSQSRRNATRTLPEVPELMLDVPALRDDFCKSFLRTTLLSVCKCNKTLDFLEDYDMKIFNLPWFLL